MSNVDPIFRSVGQALWFAYMIEQHEMSQPSPTQAVIKDLLKRSGEWLDAPTPAERSVNFSGLTPMEVRGTCAMVRGMVKDHLTEPERLAVEARYGYQKARADAVRGLRDYFQALCKTQSRDALLAVCWAIYMPSRRKGDGWSLDAISREYGAPKTVLHRDQKMIRDRAKHLECLAHDRLFPLFTKDGLVEVPAYA